MNKATTLLLAISLSTFFGSFAQERDMKKERDITLQLQAIAPDYIDEFTKGTTALDEGAYAEADSLYSIVYQHAPDFDPVIRRLGTVKCSLGQRTEGIALCEKALEINRSYANIMMIVSCLITPEDSLNGPPRDDLQRAIYLLNEATSLPDYEERDCNILLGQIALQNNDIVRFRQATNVLMARHRDVMVSHYFGALLAANDADWATADREIRIARKMGLSAEEMNQFMDSGVRTELERIENEKNKWSDAKLLMWIVLTWIAGFITLYIAGLLLSRYTLRSIEKRIIAGDLQSGTTLRRVYKILINSAGFYYYISLPIVLLLVLAIAGVIIYTCFMIGQVPIKLLIILIIGVAITVFGMLRSLFLKADRTEPGRPLKVEEAPELFNLTKDVAATMGTRPIDEIRITPDTDLAVYETGSWREKLGDNGKRVLIIGTGMLKDFEKNAFRAVLAHEYGHFSHRDTAGGGVALRVRNDMANYYFSLYTAGQAVWWNVAFLFLRFYNFLFIRISAGATRLQEVLADRVAAQTYGVQSFQNGLTFVIKRSIEFVTLANSEIEDAEKNNRPYNNLYELKGNMGETLEKELELALSRKTSEDDTHPSPVDRFRYVQGITESHPTNDSGCVSDFFTDWNALTQEMTETIRRIVAVNKHDQH